MGRPGVSGMMLNTSLAGKAQLLVLHAEDPEGLHGIRSHMTYAIHIKGGRRVIIDHGCTKGQPLSEDCWCKARL